MEVDSKETKTRSIYPKAQVNAMREEFKQKMEGKKKKKMLRPMKLSAKSKIITKGSSYNDKYEIRR